MEEGRRLDTIIEKLKDLEKDLEQIISLSNDMECLDMNINRLS